MTNVTRATFYFVIAILLLAACVVRPTATPTATAPFNTPTPDVWTPTPPPISGNVLLDPALNQYPHVFGDPRLNIAATWNYWYCGATETAAINNWQMNRANCIPKVANTTVSPWNLLHLRDTYGDLQAQALQCETSPCILYVQNQGYAFEAGQHIALGIEWNGVWIDRTVAALGFPTGYNWSSVASDPFRMRILLLPFDGGIPLYDSAQSVGWQNCQIIATVTGKDTCEPIDLNGDPILLTLQDIWTPDTDDCPAGQICQLTFRVEFITESVTISVSELWLHSAWFRPQ